jgi:uncharacterized protein YciI
MGADDKQFIYVLHATRIGMLTEGPTPEEAATVGEHFAYLKRLTEQGVMILVGRTLNCDDETMGIAVFRAATPEAARQTMEADPAVSAGVMRARLFPFSIALYGAPLLGGGSA